MKRLRINVKCPSCGSKFKFNVDLHFSQLDCKLSVCCPICKKRLKLVLPKELKNRFQPTLILDVIGNEKWDTQRFELISDYYTIGHKSSWNDLRPTLEMKIGDDHPTLTVADNMMARKHAVIRKHNNEFTIHSFGRNGTMLNGERIDQDDICYLHDGDILIMGQSVIKVYIGYKDNTEMLCKEKQSLNTRSKGNWA